MSSIENNAGNKRGKFIFTGFAHFLCPTWFNIKELEVNKMFIYSSLIIVHLSLLIVKAPSWRKV